MSPLNPDVVDDQPAPLPFSEEALNRPFPPAPVLSLKTCVVRPYHARDAENTAYHANNPAIARWMTNGFPHPYTLASAQEWINTQLQQQTEDTNATVPVQPKQHIDKAPIKKNPCLCSSPDSEGDRIKCANEQCEYDSFHRRCVSMDSEAETQSRTAHLFYCPSCRSDNSARAPRPGLPFATVTWPRATNHIIAIDNGATAIGSIGLKPGSGIYCRGAEVGYWLGEEVWGQGMGTEVLVAYVDWAFATMPELERMSAKVHSGNVGSVRVLEKCGFRKEGVQRRNVWRWGKWWDTELFAVLRDEYEMAGRK